MSAGDGEDQSYNMRRYSRGDVHIIVQVREKGQGHHQAKLADLSVSGCRVITPMYLNPDNSVFITIPGFAALESRIAWHVRDEYGCQFVNELHEAIFEHILRTHPSIFSRG